MLDICRSSQFKKDLKKIINALQLSQPLPDKNYDHFLSGIWQGYRECHISPDWLLIYKTEQTLKLLRLARTGSHSDLFK